MGRDSDFFQIMACKQIFRVMDIGHTLMSFDRLALQPPIDVNVMNWSPRPSDCYSMRSYKSTLPITSIRARV